MDDPHKTDFIFKYNILMTTQYDTIKKILSRLCVCDEMDVFAPIGFDWSMIPCYDLTRDCICSPYQSHVRSVEETPRLILTSISHEADEAILEVVQEFGLVIISSEFDRHDMDMTYRIRFP